MTPANVTNSVKVGIAMKTVRESREVRRIAPKDGASDSPAGDRRDHRRTIAVLDSETTMLELLGGELAAQGYEVLVCTDKHNFLKKLPELKVDLVITDIRSPAMDGLQFLEEFRKKKKRRNIPVIVASGVAVAVESVAKSGGAFEVFQKPYNIEDLLAAIQRALQ